jgi:hypothetical protein
MTVSQLVRRLVDAFPGRGFLVNPVVKFSGRGDVEAWFDVWVYAAHGTIHVPAAPTPENAWERIVAACALKPAPLDVFDVDSSLALRERRRA